ncbi:MAG: hypothetical protein QOI55_1172, partial [Actinomycetota bacterium]|nr:hypothetical protein [Actinomycetota bacterium]
AELAKSAVSQDAQVLFTAKVDALDITVLKGGGDAVGRWALQHGFLLTPDAPEVLDFYARRSPIFMAARFDAKRAARLGQGTGDGTPIMVTIPTDEPWVPLRILGLGLDKAKRVDADVFVLTDQRPKLLAGGQGLSLKRDEAASASLLDDLRSDKHMGWMPTSMWFTYLPLSVDAGSLTFDLAIAARPSALPSVRDAGVTASEARAVTLPSRTTLWPWFAGGAVALAAWLLIDLANRRQRRRIGAAA